MPQQREIVVVDWVIAALSFQISGGAETTQKRIPFFHAQWQKTFLQTRYCHFFMLDFLKNAFNGGAVHPESQNDGTSRSEHDAIRYAVFLSVPHNDVEASYWASHIDVHLRAAGLTVFWNEYESLLVDWQSALFNCVTFMPILSSNTFVDP